MTAVRSVLATAVAAGLATNAAAMGVRRSSGSLAKSRDGRSELFVDDASGPEGGGSIDYRVTGGEPKTFAVSSDFSPGDGSRPQVVTEAACRRALAELDALSKDRGFDGVRIHPEACATRERTGAVTVGPEPGVDLGGGFRVVTRDQKTGVVDAAGRDVVPVVNRFVFMGRELHPLRSAPPLILQAPDRSAIVVRGVEAGRLALVRYDEIQLEATGSSEGPKAWVVRRGGKWGALATDGHELLPPIYDDMTRVAAGGQAGFRSFRLGDKVGLLNPSMGKVVLPAEYDWIEPTADFYWPRAAKKSGKLGVRFGLVDEGGRVLAPFDYDAIDQGGPTWPRRAQRGGKWGLLDRSGREVVPTRFDALAAADGPQGALYFVRQGQRWGAIDGRNRTVLPVHYDKLEGLFWKYVWAVEGGQGRWLDLAGRRVDPASPRLRQAHRAVGPEAVVGGVSEPTPLEAGAPAQLRLVAQPGSVPLRFANLVGGGEPDATPHPNRLVEGRPGIREYFRVTVDNGTDQPFEPFTENGDYVITQEAQTRAGEWKPIEVRLPPVDNLGPTSPIPPRMRRESLARRYTGPFKTRLRLVMETGQAPLVSDPWAGAIDERQFERARAAERPER